MSADTPISTNKFIIDQIKPYKLPVFGIAMVAILWSLSMAYNPYIIKRMIDEVFLIHDQKGSFDTLTYFTYLFIGICIGLGLIFRIWDWMTLYLHPILKKNATQNLMNRLMIHSHGFYQNEMAGALANKVKEVMSGIPDILSLVFDTFLSRFLLVGFGIFTLWTVQFKFAMAMTIWIIVFISITYKGSKIALPYVRNCANIRSQVMGEMVDVITNIMSLRLFSTHSYEHENQNIILNAYVKADRKRDGFFSIMFTIQSLSFSIYQGCCLYFLIQGFKAGTITPGDFALVLMLNISIVDCLWSLAREMSRFSEIYGSISKALNTIYKPIDIDPNFNASPLIVSRGTIEFKNVSFHYDGKKPLFKNLNMIIHGGEKVGLVGYSGSGKTTFVNLLIRLFDINNGSITIDDQNIKNVQLSSLYNNIGAIPQDPSLFHRTLLDNIRYGQLDATQQQITDASKKAFTHDFIMQLPEQYESLVGEKGVKLSGGQRQRIAIARAILKDAPILILDEATSQLDSVVEHEIQSSLWEMMQNKTTIVIAHRLSTLMKMDRILVFNHGEIVEQGTHNELIAKNGLFKKLWDTQVGGFLPEIRES
jgi:ATP-binding cassette subfamily B protein